MNFSALKAQPHLPVTASKEEIDSSYQHWRVRMMYSMIIGYAIFYFCRKNLSAATPALIRDLGYSKTQIGAIWSVFYFTYGLSKLLNGVIGDRSNPRYFIAIGLFASALMNIFFGLSSSLLCLGFFWVINGWFQGMGWPPCVRLLTQWYSADERGKQWAIWGISHQVGGGLIMILAGYLTQKYGWRSSFYVPAAIAIATAIFLVERLRDTPESMGLPNIEIYRNGKITEIDKQELHKKHPFKDVLFNHVLKHRTIWYLGLANFCVYLVRFGAIDWAPTFLVEVKHSTIANAALRSSGFEFLGIPGTLLAGWVSDKYFRDKRWVVNVVYMLLLAFAVLEFWIIPPGHPVLDTVALSACGFLVYGPQMMVTLCAVDIAGKDAAGTASGFVSFIGYLGSIVSGIGTGWIVDHFGWNGGFAFFVGVAITGGLLFLMTQEEPRVTQ